MGSIATVSEEETPGKLIVPCIREKAKWTPNETYCRYPPPDWETNGYRTITWAQYYDTINKIAHWLDEQLGPSADFDTIAYNGPNDIRYALIWPAVIKTRRQVSHLI